MLGHRIYISMSLFEEYGEATPEGKAGPPFPLREEVKTRVKPLASLREACLFAQLLLKVGHVLHRRLVAVTIATQGH